MSRRPVPLISVVVPTRARPHRLARLLAGLRTQTLDRDAFEVIVVADGPDPSTLLRLAEEESQGGLRLRVLTQTPARGPGAARNAGWRVARAPLIAFTDDDCVPSAEWLAAGLRMSGPELVIQGRTEPDQTELANRGLLSRTVTVSELGPQYEACNMFYPRAVLNSLGGFDERYGLSPGGEDTDLAWRALESGVERVFEPRAIVSHAVERLGVLGMLRVAARWSTSVRVFSDHPQARSMLYRGLFWNVWHYLVWRSLAAMLAPRWLRRMLLTMHLVQLSRRAREGGAGAWAIPFLVVHDVVECWSVARGAVRYRTLVL